MPKKKAKNRQDIGEETEGTISRRNVLKIGAAAGAVAVVAPSILTKTALAQESVPIPLAQCIANARLESAHTPFVDELPIPFPAIDHPLSPPPPRGPQHPGGEADRDNHQRWAQFTPAHITTELEARPGLHRFHSDFGRVIYLGVQWCLSRPNDPESIWPIYHRSVPEQFAAERR